MDEPTQSDPPSPPGDFRRAVNFLLPLRSADAEPIAGGTYTAHWFVPIGLMIGTIYAAVFGGVWFLYGEYFGLRLLPTIILLVVDAGFFGNRLWRGACVTADDLCHNDGVLSRAFRPALLVLVLLIFLKAALILCLPRGQQWSIGDWRRFLLLVYPQPIYRPLILMPIWGRWAMLLALSLGRAQADEPPDFLRLMKSAKLRVVLVWLIICMALTAAYCGKGGNVAAGLLISGITLALAYLICVILAWRLGGLTRVSVYAVGLVAEMTFLFAYIPFANRIYGW